MTNQFFYTYTVTHNGTGEQETFTGSFDTTMVFRTEQVDKDSFRVIFKDGHEESKIVGRDKKDTLQKDRRWTETELFLTTEDYARYAKLHNYTIQTETLENA